MINQKLIIFIRFKHIIVKYFDHNIITAIDQSYASGKYDIIIINFVDMNNVANACLFELT